MVNGGSTEVTRSSSVVTRGVRIDMDEVHFDGYMSDSTISDSDEEYTVPYQKKRGSKSASKGTESGRGGRKPRAGAGGGGVKPEASPSKRDKVGYNSLVNHTHHPPPPLLSKSEVLSKFEFPPALIQTSSIGHGIPPKGRGGARADDMGNKEVRATHIQPPPGLIMPNTHQLLHQTGARISGGGHYLKRQPPPLVKKEVESGHPVILPSTSSPQKVYSPQIILPSGKGESLSLDNSASHDANSTSHDCSPSLRRKPGRPRKDQSVVLNSQTKKTARTVQLGSSKPNQRITSSSRGGGGGGGGGGSGGVMSVQGTSSTGKGMKLTQYEFQSPQAATPTAPPTSGSPSVILTQQGLSSAHQYHPLVITSGGSTIHPNMVTPLQIIPASVAQNNTPMHYSTVPQGGVIYLQGAGPSSPAVQSPSSSQDQPAFGQIYQLIQPRAMEDISDNAQKVSVIMQPPPPQQQQGRGGATYVQTNEVGGYHYVTQLDGLPPCGLVKKEEKEGEEEEMRRRFERVRRRAIQQLDGPVGEKEGKGSKRGKEKKSSSIRSCDHAGSSCDHHNDYRMPEKLSIGDNCCKLVSESQMKSKLGVNFNNNSNGDSTTNATTSGEGAGGCGPSEKGPDKKLLLKEDPAFFQKLSEGQAKVRKRKGKKNEGSVLSSKKVCLQSSLDTHSEASSSTLDHTPKDICPEASSSTLDHTPKDEASSSTLDHTRTDPIASQTTRKRGRPRKKSKPAEVTLNHTPKATSPEASNSTLNHTPMNISPEASNSTQTTSRKRGRPIKKRGKTEVNNSSTLNQPPEPSTRTLNQPPEPSTLNQPPGPSTLNQTPGPSTLNQTPVDDDATKDSSNTSHSKKSGGKGQSRGQGRGGGGGGKGSFACKQCEHVCTTKGGLTGHMATKHHPDIPVSKILTN